MEPFSAILRRSAVGGVILHIIVRFDCRPGVTNCSYRSPGKDEGVSLKEPATIETLAPKSWGTASAHRGLGYLLREAMGAKQGCVQPVSARPRAGLITGPST